MMIEPKHTVALTGVWLRGTIEALMTRMSGLDRQSSVLTVDGEESASDEEVEAESDDQEAPLDEFQGAPMS